MSDLVFEVVGAIRRRRDGLDALHRFRGSRALPTWDETIETLLREARESGS